MRPPDLLRDTGNMVTLTQDFSPPDFKEWRFYVAEMVTTVHIAVWGTILSVVAAVPFGLLSSEHVAPVWVRHPVRRLMEPLRAITAIALAMLFLDPVGLAPFPGLLALFQTGRAMCRDRACRFL